MRVRKREREFTEKGIFHLLHKEALESRLKYIMRWNNVHAMKQAFARRNNLKAFAGSLSLWDVMTQLSVKDFKKKLSISFQLKNFLKKFEIAVKVCQFKLITL